MADYYVKLVLNRRIQESSHTSCACGLQRLDYSHLSKSNDPILCYDEDRQFCCYILRKQNDSEKLARLIQEKGFVGGGKAYFKAYIDQTTNYLVVVPTLLPAQPW